MTSLRSDLRHSPLDALISSALQRLEDLGYSARTRLYYRRGWAALARFALSTSSPCARLRDLEADFLASCGLAPGKQKQVTWSQETIRRGLRILIEFQETGSFRCHQKRLVEPCIPAPLRREQERYEAFCKDHLHHRERTIATRQRVLTRLLASLGASGVTSAGELQSAQIAAFITERALHVCPRTLATEVGCVRSFVRFLCMRGLVPADLVAHTQSLRFSREHRLPPVWPQEAVEALLGAVDRSTNVGKRDYAILLLAARLGLRAGDIRALELDDIHWAEARLTLTQAKTGRRLSLPLCEEIGQALIDYIRHARPSTHLRRVFLKARAPHQPFGSSNSLHSVMASVLRRTDVTLPEGMPRGLHALRHTLATQLVLRGQRLETVAAVLGHRSIESTRVYTHLDVEALREVALDPEEVCRG